MKDVKFESHFSALAYRINAEIGKDVDEKTTKLTIRGLADTGFRGLGSGVEKALVAAGYLEKGAKRSTLKYSAEVAAIVQKVGQELLDEIAEKDGLPEMVLTITGEHIIGEGGASAMVRATTFVDTLLSTPETEENLRSMFGVLGMKDAEDADREALIAFAHSQGVGKQPAKKQK